MRNVRIKLIFLSLGIRERVDGKSEIAGGETWIDWKGEWRTFKQICSTRDHIGGNGGQVSSHQRQQHQQQQQLRANDRGLDEAAEQQQRQTSVLPEKS